MKKILLSLGVLALTLNANISSAQTDCSGNRYSQQIFTGVNVESAIKYGENFKRDGITNEELFLDIYTPQGDVDNNRPVVLLAHGGSFMGGNRADIADLCKNFAKMGYVSVSISYRLLSTTDLFAIASNTAQGFKEEVVRAVHDMKAAVRFMKKSYYEEGNPYGINPNVILVGGWSAGAILANHVAYIDSDAKIPAELTTYFSQQGGLEGNSGNPGYNSRPKMVLSMCGAIMDTLLIDSPDQQPYFGTHTMEDLTVPPLSGQPNVGIQVAVDLYGDSLMYKRAQNIGLPSKYVNYETGGHCQFGPDYFNQMTDFMHDQLCIQGLATKDNTNEMIASVYPNPASSEITVDIPGNAWNSNVTLVDITGKEVYSTMIPVAQNITNIDVSSLSAGIYQVLIHTNDGRSAVKKVVIE